MYFLALSTERAKKQASPAAMSTQGPDPPPTEEPGLSREMANPRDGQSRYQMNLEYLVRPQRTV